MFVFRPANIALTPELRPNVWDLMVLPVMLGVLFLVAYGGQQMNVPYNVGDPLPLSLDPANLPYYLLRTVMRMGAALLLSLVFTLVYATLAAKYALAEKVLIPFLDVLQSVPILGFLSVTVTGFIALFPGNLLGVECAAIFAIFTSQAWNMTFSMYQSLRTVPYDLVEAAAVFRLSPWQRFWRLELPYSMPGLVWNMMMSVSGGWFFVVASEAISVSGQSIMLPGIGSYIALAIQDKNLGAIGYAILAMLAAITCYDQMMFRPLVAWADKFKFEQSPGEELPTSRLLTWIQRARLLRLLTVAPRWAWDLSVRLTAAKPMGQPVEATTTAHPWANRAWDVGIAAVAGIALLKVGEYIHGTVGAAEVGRVFGLALATAARVLLLTLLASVVWVPIGVWIGMRPKWAQNLQWVAQFLAAFPANLMFPPAVILILHYNLSVEIWVSPLMVLGTQWYILFNVIAGASALPQDLRDAAGNLHVKGWLRWKRFYLPGIFPHYITGAITASGGAWNASIVAEMVNWGDTTLTATGVGAYIAQATQAGDFPRIALGVSVMCLFVMGFNRFLWRRLNTMAEERLRLG